LRGYGKSGVVEAIRAAGGEIFAVTSEPQTLATRAQDEWKLDYESVGDPHHEISATCRDRGWLELYVNEKLGFLERSTRGNDWSPTHPKGYFQPGVIALEQSGRVLYRWRGVPTHQNTGGATERPTAEHVWANTERALGGSTLDVVLDDDPPLDQRAAPWPLFVALLVANGWFVEARGFPHLEHGPSPQTRVLVSGLRLVGFVGAWTAAFWWLPALPVAAALVGWAAWITPKVRFINDEFQDASRA
jgi:hypothetical protein